MVRYFVVVALGAAMAVEKFGGSISSTCHRTSQGEPHRGDSPADRGVDGLRGLGALDAPGVRRRHGRVAALLAALEVWYAAATSEHRTSNKVPAATGRRSGSDGWRPTLSR
jgi:hypothetical protein